MWKTLCKTRPDGAEKWLFRRVLHTFNRVFTIKMEENGIYQAYNPPLAAVWKRRRLPRFNMREAGARRAGGRGPLREAFASAQSEKTGEKDRNRTQDVI